jgi:hypothetical protein
MAVNWKGELKKHALKKIKEMLDRMGMLDELEDRVSTDNIQVIEVPFKFTQEMLDSLDVKDLSRLYAHMIMREDFEHAGLISNLLQKKGFEVTIDTYEIEKRADIVIKPQSGATTITIPMKVYPDGMMIDFEKEDDI